MERNPSVTSASSVGISGRKDSVSSLGKNSVTNSNQMLVSRQLGSKPETPRMVARRVGHLRSAEVSENTRFILEVEKTFKCLNEKELRKLLQVGRLTKEALKGIPSIRVPTPSGQQETLFIFRPDTPTHRTAKLRMIVEDYMSVRHMEPAAHLWEEQGQHTLRHTYDKLAGRVGLGDLMDKDNLSSLEQFLEKRQAAKAKDGDANMTSKIESGANTCGQDDDTSVEEDVDLEDSFCRLTSGSSGPRELESS